MSLDDHDHFSPMHASHEAMTAKSGGVYLRLGMI